MECALCPEIEERLHGLVPRSGAHWPCVVVTRCHWWLPPGAETTGDVMRPESLTTSQGNDVDRDFPKNFTFWFVLILCHWHKQMVLKKEFATQHFYLHKCHSHSWMVWILDEDNVWRLSGCLPYKTDNTEAPYPRTFKTWAQPALNFTDRQPLKIWA